MANFSLKEIAATNMSVWFINLVLLMFYSLIIDITAGLDTCSPVCVSCINDTCVTCDVGNYLESGSCHSCLERCSSCNNSMICDYCTEGYYGLSCEKNCVSSMCLNNTCDKDSGACLYGCIKGYFLSGASCYPCASYCKTCANFSNTCLECKDGFYGPSCQNPCSYCKDSICTMDNCTYGCGDGFVRANEACYSCPKLCTSCSIQFDNCHACVDGYFGSGCQYECSDCSPCNQDGSCPTTTLRPSAPATTSISSLPSMSQSARSTYVVSTTHQSYFPTSSDSNNEGGKQKKQTMDNTIKYAVGGGAGGLFVIVMIVFVVFVTKRRSGIKRRNLCINSQGRESDGAAQDYTTLAMETRQGDGHIYSSLDNAPNIVTTETMSTTRDHSGQETDHVLPQKNVCDTEPGYYSNVN